MRSPAQSDSVRQPEGGRLRDPTDGVVYAPEFRREIEEPVAAAVAVPAETPLVVTEGSYLLIDEGPWREVRTLLDEVWYVTTGEDTRRRWLVQRRIRYGRSPEAARAWALGTDQRNAEVVEGTRTRADARVGVDGSTPGRAVENAVGE